MSKKKDHHSEEPNLDQAGDAVAQPTESTSTIEELQKKLEAAEAAVADANDKMLRSKAEAENARRRSALDVENAHKFSVEKIARELVNVVDSMEHGLDAVSEPDKAQIAHLREGMHLTHKLLLDILEKFQIKQINPQGEVFDPKQHEALTAQATNELEPNRVLTVVQKGFTIHDRVLRPARVIVTKAPQDVTN